MDRFNSFASSAKAKAESAASSAKSSYDNRNNPSSSSASSSSSAPVPNIRGGDPPPPSRGGGAPIRSNYSNNSSGSAGGLFVGINETERGAFFSLLDEYFETRPHYKEAFIQSQQSQSPPSAPTPIRTVPIVVQQQQQQQRQAPPPTPVSRGGGLGSCKALYDYIGGEEGDLSFNEGDKITLLEFVSDDWWKGSLKGREGIFPSGYVEKI